jgi:hypothetical protein
VEIYKGSLSADEVSNLYNGKRYDDFTNDSGLLLNLSARGGIMEEKTGKNVTVIGNGITIKKILGKVNAIYFPGVSGNYLDCGSDFIGTLPNVSVCLWHKCGMLAINKGSGSGSLVKNGKFDFSKGYLAGVGFTVARNSGVDGFGTAAFGTKYLNNWSFVTATFNGSNNKAIVTINLETTGLMTIGNPVSGTTNVQIGGLYAGYPYSGYINDIKIFNRVLTTAEISRIYTAEKVYYE